MRIIVADGFRPFVEEREEGEAQRITETLRRSGHEVEILRIPRGADLVRTSLAARLTDVSDAGELLVAVGPPAHLLRHPRKVLWCEGADFGAPSRLAAGDRAAFDEARAVIAASSAAGKLVREWWAGEIRLAGNGPDLGLVDALLA